MRHDPCSERIVIECGCGEKMVIVGREDDWRSRNPVFRCECGEKFTLAGDTSVENSSTSARRSDTDRSPSFGVAARRLATRAP
jgi:hypothetical protein